MKGVAVKTLFLVVVIGIIIFFSLIIFWHWFSSQITIVTSATCTAKVWNYCQRWYDNKKDPGDWDEVSPTDEDCRAIEGLENFGKPTEEDCQNLLGVWYE
ncbi:MAG: hypothetical protein ACE5J3_05135 [Methanosarcinales archaeon]